MNAMKRMLFSLLVVMLLNSCGMVKYAEYSSILKYNEYEDFFITESNSVNFPYEPVGGVNSLIKSGYYKRKYIAATAEDALYLLCQ